MSKNSMLDYVFNVLETIKFQFEKTPDIVCKCSVTKQSHLHEFAVEFDNNPFDLRTAIQTILQIDSSELLDELLKVDLFVAVNNRFDN